VTAAAALVDPGEQADHVPHGVQVAPADGAGSGGGARGAPVGHARPPGIVGQGERGHRVDGGAQRGTAVHVRVVSPEIGQRDQRIDAPVRGGW